MSEEKVIIQHEVAEAQQEYENKQRFQKETVEKIEQNKKEREEQREKKKKDDYEKEKIEKEKLSLWTRLINMWSEERQKKFLQELQEVSRSYDMQAKELNNQQAGISKQTINEEIKKKQGHTR